MDALKKGKYIFCVSPGRSGTYYLSQIFDLVPGVCSVHEPDHQFSRYSELKPHEWKLKDNLLSNSYSDRRRIKWWQINDLMSESGAESYVETNPLFCTLWHDVILADSSACDIKVIVLRRNSVEVLKSILDLGWYWKRNGDDWMVSSYSINSLFKPPMKEAQASPLEKVISYLINVELYTQKIKSLCRVFGHELIEVNSEDIFSNVEFTQSILSKSGFRIEEKNIESIQLKKRNKSAAKKKYGDISIELCEKGIQEYFFACGRAGLKVPNLWSSTNIPI